MAFVNEFRHGISQICGRGPLLAVGESYDP